MKTPRVTDFDPSQAVPQLASPMDEMPSIEPPQSPSLPPSSNEQIDREESVPNSSIPEVRPPVVPYARTPVRRTITRYAFEFFQDQIDSLRRFALEEKTQGEKGSMSEMVREALDMYIAKRHRTED